MTAGHKHWVILKVHPDSRVLRVLQSVTVWRSRDVVAVDRSRFPYTGKTPDSIEPGAHGYWRLSLLGFIHGLTGAVVEVRE